MPAEDTTDSSTGVQSTQGHSGVIGGSKDGVNAHDVCQFKSLDYR